MEFVVAILSAAASSAVSSAVTKLGRVIADSVAGEAGTDATFIKNELQQIKGVLIEDNSLVGRYASPLRSTWIAILRSLAYDIEDCIDCFEANKTSREEFAARIAQLKRTSEDTRKQILDYMEMHGRLQQGQQGQDGQQLIAPPAADVPREVQQLLGRQSKDWLNCLLYFCMFPDDHHARRNPLIRRWLAEGLVNEEGGEAKAKEYLEDLINGNIINTTAKCNNGNIKRCQPPDGIHNFIRQQSSSTNFMLFCTDMATTLRAGSARRLSLHPNQDILDDMDMDLPAFPHLHTLAVFHDSDNPHIYETIVRFDNYEMLRVLDLKECVALSEEHLFVICNLLLLKYLSFQYGTDRLPRAIGNLTRLETLDMRGGETVTVHKEVLMMPRLKHLLGKFQLSRTDTVFWTVRDCRTTDLGVFLKKKSCLQTLSGFVTGGRHGFPQLMILMRMLRKVKIWCKRNASEENLGDISGAITNFIRGGLQDLSLSLSIDFQECSGQFLNNVQVQNGGLNSLKLHGNLSELPPFVMVLRGVEELCLSSTALSWNVIVAGLSNFRSLNCLKLAEDNLGHVEILPQHLPSLKRLCLVCLTNLDITIQAGALPGLVSLHLICQDLDVVPGTPQMEITQMARLQEVGVHSQLNQAIKQGWENAAEAHPNTPRVFDV